MPISPMELPQKRGRDFGDVFESCIVDCRHTAISLFFNPPTPMYEPRIFCKPHSRPNGKKKRVARETAWSPQMNLAFF